MEVGIGTQASHPLMGMRQESTLFKKELDGFSKLLGFVSNHVVEREEVKQPETLSLLVSLQGILRATELDEVGLSSGQLEDLSRLKEFDFDQIAEIVGMDKETVKTLFSELQSALIGTEQSSSSSGDSIEDLHETLLGTMQLLQSALKNEVGGLNGRGPVEEVARLVKVIELLAANRDLLVMEASKASELKDMMKMVQAAVDQSLSREFNHAKDWSRILKDAFQRQAPVQTMEKQSSTERVTVEKKSIQPILASHIHFVLPKTESVSMSLSSGNRSVQYEQFVKEFQNILSKSQMVSQPNMSKLLIKLYPEQLGSLRIELLQQNGVMNAKILASTATAKEMLDSQIQGLKHAFTSQNLQVEKIEISQALTDAERQSKGQSQQQSSQQHKQNQPEHGGSGGEERTESFKEYLVNTEI
ncbi:flagellar hook-length control protein FliK [Rossellomorea sp. y25]|uniref:flagellar hook-length control protein FliK n=1 Tax=Rossellomorea sp. y25 TaxID=3118174 RepID=UPI0030E3C65E